jgi:recombination protein RecT
MTQQRTTQLARGGANSLDKPAQQKAAVAKAPDRAGKFMNGLKEQIALALPKHMTADKMARVVLTEFRKNPALMRCLETNPASVAGAIMTASQLGLEIGSHLGLAYLIPYGNECQFQIGYKGLVLLARRSGEIQDIYAHPVLDGDEFTYTLGIDRSIVHHPSLKLGSDRPLTQAYAVSKFVGGGYHLEVMNRDEIDGIRKRSRSGSKGPWVTDFSEMAKKTVLRRLCKMLPVSTEQLGNIVQAAARDEAIELGYEASPQYDHETGEILDGQRPEYDGPVTEPVNEDGSVNAEVVTNG